MVDVAIFTTITRDSYLSITFESYFITFVDMKEKKSHTYIWRHLVSIFDNNKNMPDKHRNRFRSK